MPNNPSVTVNLRKSRSRVNPQGFHAMGCVMGYSKLGTRKQIYTLRSDADLVQFGNGEGIEMLAEICTESGYPQRFMPIAGTGQNAGTVTKTPASAGVPFTIYGSARLDGADVDGDTLWQGKQPGVSFAAQAGGALLFTFSGTGNKDVTLAVPAATPADDIETYYNGGTADAVSARALVSFKKYGTGNSVSNQTLARVYFDNGAITFTPLGSGYEVRQQFGAGATNGGTFGGQQLTVTPTTNGDSQPTSTASALVSAMAANLANKITAVAGGSGAGAPGELASFQALQFGSTAALSISGTGTDDHSFVLTVTRGGAIGGTGLAFTWSADGGVITSAEVAIPTSGIVELKDSVLDTGLTATFTGTLEVGDVWTFSVAKPVVAVADLLDGIDVIDADNANVLGWVSSPTVINRTQAALILAKLLAMRQRKWIRGYFNVRDFNTGETRAQFEAAMSNDFLGFVAERGALSIAAGHYSHLSDYTGRRFRRPAVMEWLARRCAMAVHQDPMEKADDTGGGSLSRIRYAVDANGVVIDPGIFYDAYPNGALPSQRFICLRTWPGEVGRFYVNESPTMADPSDLGYSQVPYVDFVWELARLAQQKLALTVGKTYASIAEPEDNGNAPAGALDVTDAQGIDDLVNQDLDAFAFSAKTDGKPSASPMPVGERLYKTRRDYSYSGMNPPTVKGTIQPYLRAINKQVVVDVTPVLAG